MPGPLTSTEAKAAGRASVSRDSFDIAEARAGLRQCLAGSRKSELQMYKDLRDAGRFWITICAWLDDKSLHGGVRISAQQWADDPRNSPLKKRWLDQHAQFARDWPDFLIAWNWAEETHFSPDRKPSLRSAQILLELKRRHDTHQSTIAKRRSTLRVLPAPKLIVPHPEKIFINPNQTLLHGDIVEMARQHTPDGSLDMIIADPPYNLPTPPEETQTDITYDRYAIHSRFREDWDEFADVEAYREFCEGWLNEAMRCLDKRGSLFVCCSYFSIGPIMWLVQNAKWNFPQLIQVCQFNQRPVVTRRTLQYSHYTVIWITKHPTEYRFDYDACKWGTWPRDRINATHGQLLRDTWNINHNGRENTTEFPSQKPLALYQRLLTMCGRGGGMMGDWFSGSGTGAVAALRWGMKSTSIEREPRYVPDIIARIELEMKKKAGR